MKPVSTDRLPDIVEGPDGTRYKVLKPSVPDPEGWVRLMPGFKKRDILEEALKADPELLKQFQEKYAPSVEDYLNEYAFNDSVVVEIAEALGVDLGDLNGGSTPAILKQYVVLYHQSEDDLLVEPLVFICQAENGDHAAEQCVNANPGCQIEWVLQSDETDNDKLIKDAYYNYYQEGLS